MNLWRESRAGLLIKSCTARRGVSESRRIEVGNLEAGDRWWGQGCEGGAADQAGAPLVGSASTVQKRTWRHEVLLRHIPEASYGYELRGEPYPPAGAQPGPSQERRSCLEPTMGLPRVPVACQLRPPTWMRLK